MIYQGDCREVMRRMIAEGISVQTCVTSPPYWGLRNYGVEGQLGLEPTPEEFISNMVEVFDLVKQLLKPDGTLWLNIGDSYMGSGKGFGDVGIFDKQNTNKGSLSNRKLRPHTLGKHPDIKPKDLVGIPWMLAFALRSAGWYLRQDIIWSKPNPMPESVTDRCTKAHEYLFLLSKSNRYYCDMDAIKEAATFDSNRRPEGWATGDDHSAAGWATEKNQGRGNWRGSSFDKGKTGEMKDTNGHLKRSGNKERKDGSERGCPDDSGSNVCGSVPWEGNTRNKRSVWTVPTEAYSEAHFATYPQKLIEPCILAGARPGDTVLDPFNGSGTTGRVSYQHGRKYIGIELNPQYIEMAERRISGTQIDMLTSQGITA